MTYLICKANYEQGQYVSRKDMDYLLALARKDVKYLRGRAERRGHKHNMPQRDPDATKVAKRAELVAKLESVMEEDDAGVSSQERS